jgi:hypothetical protein
MRRAGSTRSTVFVFVAALAATSVATTSASADSSPGWLEQYREPAARLIGEAVGSTSAWQRLAVLTDSIGHRISGSAALDRAIAWAVAEMQRDGLENVHTERVMVPRWIRGAESADIVAPTPHSLVMLGLGDSVGTPAEGVQAEVMVVRNFEELEAHGGHARGRRNGQISIAGTIPSRARRSGRRSGPRRRPPRSADAAHRRAAVRRRCAEDTRGGNRDRRRRPHPAHGRSRRPRCGPPQNGSTVRPRGRIGERCR